MDKLSKELIRQMNITNLRTHLLPKGWSENRRHGFLLSPADGLPKQRYVLRDPDACLLQRKITFTRDNPYVRGMRTWEDVWSAPWEKLTFGSDGEVGVRASRKAKSEQKSSEANQVAAEQSVEPKGDN